MATYSTEIQFGGFDAPWQDDSDPVIEIKNRKSVIPANGAK